MANRLLITIALAAVALAAAAVLREREGIAEYERESAEQRDREAESGGPKIATWNLQWFPGKKPKPSDQEAEAQFVAAVEAIGELDADILCLQEVREVEGNVHLERLAEATGYTVQTVSNFDHQQEVAILFREPANASWFAEFEDRERERNPPRGFAYAHFKLEGYPEIHLYGVHLKSNSGGIEEIAPKREEAARQLVARAGGVAGAGVAVIAGDLNTDPTRPDWEKGRIFQAATNFATVENHPTSGTAASATDEPAPLAMVADQTDRQAA